MRKRPVEGEADDIDLDEDPDEDSIDGRVTEPSDGLDLGESTDPRLRGEGR